MSFYLPPPATPIPPGALPVRLLQAVGATDPFATTYTGGGGNTIVVLTGVDATATEGGGVQCFFDLNVEDGTVFYHDSQTIGEGAGVSFAWRGALPIGPDQSVTATGSTSGGFAEWGIIGYGYLMPGPAGYP